MPTEPAAPPDAIRLSGLRKEFGSIVAVDGIDLRVPTGSVYGYLGPNGAGKTTSMRMMLGLIRPTSGTVEMLGRDPQVEGVGALEGVAGFVESPMFYPYLSARKNLSLLSDLDGGIDRPRITEVLEIVELDRRADDKVGGYSQGMRQRLGLAAALLRRPRLLLLDEPTNGLDPGGMRDMRGLIGQLAGEGLTVLLSSHLMAEIEQLCTELAIIAAGRIRFAGTLAQLRAGHDGPDYRLTVADVDAALAVARDVVGVEAVAVSSGSGRDIELLAEPDAASALTVRLGQAGIGILAMMPAAASLEQLFFELTDTPSPEPKTGKESAA